MPKLDGYEVARRIRATEWGQGTLLVAVTGWELDSDREESLTAGFDHHLVKPVALDALFDLLQRQQRPGRTSTSPTPR